MSPVETSLAGKTTAINEFINEVAVLIAVMGAEDINKGFKVCLVLFNLPPFIKNSIDDAVKEKIYDIKTAHPALSAPFVSLVARETRSIPAINITASSSNSIML